MWKRVLFNLYVFFIGFRFYKILKSDREELYDEVEFNFNYGQPWVFKFYRTNVEYHECRWSRFRDFKRVRYSIGTNFTEDHPELAKKYNSWLMSFYVPYLDLLPEKSVSRWLLDKYIEHIVYEIQQSKQQVGRQLGETPVEKRRRHTDQ